MTTQSRKMKAREVWINTYLALGSVSKAARRCEIPRSTLYRWLKRYQNEGLKGLVDQSQKPKTLAKQKLTSDMEQLMLSIREKHSFGPQRLQIHLL